MASDAVLGSHALGRHRMLGTSGAKTVRDQRRALVWWGLGFVGTVVMYAAFWPNVRENAEQLTRYIQNMPAVIRNLIGGINFATAEGYVQSELFTFIAPTLLLVYAVGAGAKAIAGEEEAGSLDLLLSTPVRRSRVLLGKFGAMLAATFGLVLLMWLCVLAVGPLFDLTPNLAGLTAMSINTFLLGLGFGTVALAIGAGTGSKGLAIGVPSGIALVTFILNALAPSVDWLEPFRLVSPFYYYSGSQPMLNGLDPVHAFALAAITVVSLGVALWMFERRDLAA